MAKLLKGITTQILAMDGKPINDERGLPLQLNKILANAIASARSADAVKAMILAQDLYKAEKDFKIDDADLELLKKNIKENTTLLNLVKAPIVQALDSAEDV